MGREGNNMASKKIMVCMAATALVAALALVGCGGQAASSSAASSAAASSAAASASAASASAASAAAASASASAASASAASASAAAASSAAASASSDAYIGSDAAKEIALTHASVAEADAIELEVNLDTDDAVIHYDVEFKAGGQEYDYDIDPATGEILKYDSEIDD